MKKTILASLLVIGCAAVPVDFMKEDLQQLMCGNKPNCASSIDTRPSFYMPPFQFDDSPKSAMDRLIRSLKQQKRTTIINSTETTLHAVRATAVFRFKDDLYFIMNPDEQLIHFKSAARTGYSDFGVNRKHIEKIRSAFESK